MSTIYQRNTKGKPGNFYYETIHKGERIRFSLKTKDKREARRFQKKYDIQFEIDLNNPFKKTSWYELSDIYLSNKELTVKPTTLKRYKEIINDILMKFDKMKLFNIKDISSKHINNFIKIKQNENSAPKTIHENLRTIRSLLQTAYEENLIDEIPIRKWPKIKVIPKSKNTIGYYTYDEINKFKDYFVNTEFYDFFLFLIYTGARESEILSLNKKDIDFSQNMVRLHSIKTESSGSDMFRHIEIHPNLLNILKNRTSNLKKEENVFSIEDKSKNWLRRQILSACKKLNIPYRRLHGLRHTFISTMLNNGVPLRAVMEMAGHKNPQTTMRYSHISQNELKGKINKIEY